MEDAKLLQETFNSNMNYTDLYNKYNNIYIFTRISQN